METKYLYHDREIRKTGRRAEKQGPEGKYANFEDTVRWEIEPVKLAEGEMTWTVWVSDYDLYVIKEKEEE